MAKLLHVTRYNAEIRGKPRVYFTCHPKDFAACFDKIRNDILTAQDVVLYYTEDMADAFDPQLLETDLGQMNLFVVPITRHLLNEPSRAMAVDIAYAKQHEIPILPLMMEPDLNALYSRPDMFGQIQYLNPYSEDISEIRYEDKLVKFLSSALVSSEMAQRVRGAFDAYIFLSYRKKDRQYANELMKQIHKNPVLWDVAVWFDEYLTPGENFEDNIKRALLDSKLVTLLVTPNLLEESDGKPNFVMGEEYPAAVKAEKHIIPAQMVQTDLVALAEKFPGIPQCVDPQDETAFQSQLLSTIQKVSVTANDLDPEHRFLIGLAYMEGIDVEINRHRGMQLMISAAKAGYPEAMVKLADLYCNGNESGYPEAVKWAKCLYDHYRKESDPLHPELVSAIRLLARVCSLIKDYSSSLELHRMLYTRYCDRYGQLDERVWSALHDMSVDQYHKGEHSAALELSRQECDLRSRMQSPEHPDLLIALLHQANIYSELKDRQKQIRLLEYVYEIKTRVFGEDSQEALKVLSQLSTAYVFAGNYDRGVELRKRALSVKAKLYGEYSLHLRYDLLMLAASYGRQGDYAKQIAVLEYRNLIELKHYGQEHTGTLYTQQQLIVANVNARAYEKAIELGKKVYEIRCKMHGQESKYALEALDYLAYAYAKNRNYEMAVELFGKEYALRCKTQGEEHKDTLQALDWLAFEYGKLGNYAKCVELTEKLYLIRCRLLGEGHKLTQETKSDLATARKKLEESN